MNGDETIRLADGRAAREVHDEEVAADLEVERMLLVKELIAFAIVIAIIIIRQRYFV